MRVPERIRLSISVVWMEEDHIWRWRLALFGVLDVPRTCERPDVLAVVEGERAKLRGTLPATAGAATFRAFSAAGYKGDFSRVPAGHVLTTLGKHIASLVTATLSPQPARPTGPSAELRAR